MCLNRNFLQHLFLSLQADPSSVDPAKLSPNRPVRHPGRSMSVQSSLDPWGSNTTLASSASSEIDSGRHSSEGHAGGSVSPLGNVKEA